MPLLKTDAPALNNIDSWINSAPIDLEEGTHLLYFWNYSCNCCRQRIKLFQQINQQYSEIKVIGIHTPEFVFEQVEGNLRNAVDRMNIEHTIAHDIQGETSENYDMAYSNQAVIVDKGSIVHQQTNRMEGERLVEKVSEILETEKEVDISELDQDIPPQQFFGYSRTLGLNQEGNYPGKKNYRLPKNRKKEETYLKGTWEQTEYFIEAGDNSELWFNFESSEVSLVIDPNDSIRDIEVLINGEPVSEEDAGEDLRVEDGRSYLRSKHPDIYTVFDSDFQANEITLIPDKKTRFYALSFR